jgi:cytosine deaminase
MGERNVEAIRSLDFRSRLEAVGAYSITRHREACQATPVLDFRARCSHHPHMDDVFLAAAIAEAQQGLAEGGIPIGSVLVLDGKIVGRGHNRRVQNGSAVLHAEMDCLERAGRLVATDYRRATLYSTLSPCDMCSGAVLLYGIPRVVVGENQTFRGPEDYVRSRGVVLDVRNDAECVAMMEEFIARRPELWNEDIGR